MCLVLLISSSSSLFDRDFTLFTYFFGEREKAKQSLGEKKIVSVKLLLPFLTLILTRVGVSERNKKNNKIRPSFAFENDSLNFTRVA